MRLVSQFFRDSKPVVSFSGHKKSFLLVIFNLSLGIAMTKDMTSVLVDKTKESDRQSIKFELNSNIFQCSFQVTN